MSFNSDKKHEHEQFAERCLERKEYSQAFFHMAKAADFGFNLAEQSEGKVARAHFNDANELVELASKLKVKARSRADGNVVTKQHEATSVQEPTATTSDWQLQVRPDIKLDDVAGLDEVKAALRDDVINAMLYPETYKRFNEKGGGGVIMYGPPGNGKTFIAKAIAGEVDAAFFAVDASQIKDKYVGETEKNMRRLFEQARQHKRAVIFFDEVDALLQKRGNQKVNAVTQFLILADGIANDSDCALLLLGATNKPWSIDSAALRPGRFDKQIYVGLPDQAAREGIVRYCLKSVPVEYEFPFEECGELTEGFSGADLAEICSRAKKAAIRRQINSGMNELVTRNDFKESLAKTIPSVDFSSLVAYEEWRKGPLRRVG